MHMHTDSQGLGYFEYHSVFLNHQHINLHVIGSVELTSTLVSLDSYRFGSTFLDIVFC